MDDSFSKNCYYVCMAVIGYGVVGYLLSKLLHYDCGKLFPPCRLFQETGYYCIGCGGTRALKSLFSGHPIQSFFFHPAVDYVVFILAIFIPSQSMSVLSQGRIRGYRLRKTHFYILGGIVIVQWLLKNMVYLIWGIHLI